MSGFCEHCGTGPDCAVCGRSEPKPLPIGTPYDGSTVAEVVHCEHSDDYQPHLYQLADGRQVWIPVDELFEVT